MENIEGQEPEKNELVIPPLWMTFARFVKVIRSNMEDLYISYMECQDKERIEEVKFRVEYNYKKLWILGRKRYP